MNINWGTKIAILYIGFVVMIVSLVAASAMKKVDLVADNYYEQEIVYQKRLDASRAGVALPEPVSITARAGDVDISLPSIFNTQSVAATVHFYAAANSAADKVFQLQTSDAHLMIERSKLSNARYEVQISWQIPGRDYYQSIPLNLQ